MLLGYSLSANEGNGLFGYNFLIIYNCATAAGAIMKEKSLSPLRIGMVNFINTAPIHETWKSTVQPSSYRLIEAVPSKLNRMLAAREIDLGFVSSYEYCVRPEQYRILSDLSISANGSVGSVFLFSRIKPQALNGCRLLLSRQSETSVGLLKIILEEFYGVKPGYTSGSVNEYDGGNFDGVLAIGDQALTMARQTDFPYRMDLGEVWKHHTGLPFVFALCCVQEELCVSRLQNIKDVHRQLVRCRKQGQQNLDWICKTVASRLVMDRKDCQNYLSGIEYDLDLEKQEALNRFFSYLIKRGEASSNALPLKIQSL